MTDIAFLDSRRISRLACDPPELVRERPERGQDSLVLSASPESPAHPSIHFPIPIDAAWRVVDDPLQWILQRRKGNLRGKNSGWDNRHYCRTRDGLMRCILKHCGDVDPGTLETLSMLPEWHP
jgi:hypothetical protein